VINMDCTIEWEILPKNVPDLAASYPELTEIEKNVVDQQARKISQNRGLNYGSRIFWKASNARSFRVTLRPS